MMYIPDIIKIKREGKKLSEKQIDYMIGEYVKGNIPDYQAASFLMACFINGLNERETFYLTDIMRKSGDIYDFSDIEGIKVDKHSTGGVGDKISIPLAPILGCLGFIVPMVSGRGLGHTGGTLDKLESIKGLSVNIGKTQFRKQLQSIGVVMAGQTKNFVPADKKLYALRDVTGTVESVPLITASIMSKKMAEGIDSLLLDVKQGNGAFMKTMKDALLLAENMYNIGKFFNKNMIYAVTDMSQIIGDTAGNGIEIMESIDILKGKCMNSAYELVREFSIMLLIKNKIYDKRKEALNAFNKVIDSGKAYEMFLKMISMQKGDVKCLKKTDLLSNRMIEIKADKKGYLKSMDVYQMGVALIHLKAGRFRKEDNIDHKTGIFMNKHVGDAVDKNETIMKIYHNGVYEEALHILKKSFILSENDVPFRKLIKITKGIE